MDLVVNREAESFRVTVMVQQRPDGGLRAWSDDVPGLVLSHRDAEKVLADIEPVLEVLLSEQAGRPVKAEKLQPFPTSARRKAPRRLEYTASPLAA